MINPFILKKIEDKSKTAMIRVDTSFRDLVKDIKEETTKEGKDISEVRITKLIRDLVYPKIINKKSNKEGIINNDKDV